MGLYDQLEEATLNAALATIDSMQPAGRAAGGFVFTRTDGGQWRKSHQIRPMLDACRRAKINPAVSFHTLRHTHGATLAMRGAPMAVLPSSSATLTRG